MRARRTAGMSRQAGNAAAAAFTATSTSAAFANGTDRMTSPVAGFVTSPNRVLFDRAASPLIQSGTRVTAGVDTAAVLDIVSSAWRRAPGSTVLYSRHEAASPGAARTGRIGSGRRRCAVAVACRGRVPEVLGRAIAVRGGKARRRRAENR